MDGHMRFFYEHYTQTPDGTWFDEKCFRVKRGMRVRLTTGPHAGGTGEIGNRVPFYLGQADQDSYENQHGFCVTLDDGRWVTVRWDWVARV